MNSWIKKHLNGYGFLYGIAFAFLCYPLFSILASHDEKVAHYQEMIPFLKELPEAMQRYEQEKGVEPAQIQDLIPAYLKQKPRTFENYDGYGLRNIKLGRPFENLDGDEKLTVMAHDKFGFGPESACNISYDWTSNQYITIDTHDPVCQKYAKDYFAFLSKGEPFSGLYGLMKFHGVLFVLLLLLGKPITFAIGSFAMTLWLCYPFLIA